MTIDPSTRLSDSDLSILTKLAETQVVSFDAATVNALLTEIEELKSELEGADQTLDALEHTSGTLSMAEIKIAGLERRVDSLEDMFGTQDKETQGVEQENERLLKQVASLKETLREKDMVVEVLTKRLTESWIK